MPLFSASSFIDLLNALVCFILSNKLRYSYLKSNNVFIKNFSIFYFVFAIFCLFLGLPFFMPSYPYLIQSSFVISHFFLYSAMAVFLSLFLKLIQREKLGVIVMWFVILIGATVFYFSWKDGGDARIFFLSNEYSQIISWSHGGNEFFRLLIGLAGTILGSVVGIFFIFFSRRAIKDPKLRIKGLILGLGLMLLGLAAFLAFVLSIFPFYNFF